MGESYVSIEAVDRHIWIKTMEGGGGRRSGGSRKKKGMNSVERAVEEKRTIDGSME